MKKQPHKLCIMKNRKCLQCYEQLVGRADQKFCSDECRNVYNNNKFNNESNKVINSVNRILKKNYSILSSFLAEGKVTTSKIDLQKKGYQFDFFTSVGTTRSGRVNYFCYNQGFRENEHDKITLLRLPPNTFMPEIIR